MAKYKLLVGKHVDDGKVYNARDNENNTIETKKNLLKLNGGVSTPKFELLTGDPDADEKELKQEAARARALAEDDTPARTHRGVQGGVGGIPQPAPLTVGEQAAAKSAEKASAPARTTSPNFDTMNLKQLQDHAAQENVDVKGAKTREEYLKVLKG